MSTLRTDEYPSRDGRPPRILPRIEPVLHGAPAARAMGPLDAEQLASFERDGFLLVPRALDERAVDALRQDLVAQVREAGDVERPEVVRERASGAVRSIFEVHRGEGPLAALAAHRLVREAAQQILASDVYVHQSRVNVKPGLVGAGFSWHSDFETWHAEDGMPRMRALSASVWLTDNHAWNGPLMLVPGSHRWFVSSPARTPPRNWSTSLVDQQVGSPDAATMRALFERLGVMPAMPIGPAGALLLFDCNTMHASGANLSPLPRSNAFFVMNAVSNALEAPFGAAEPRPRFLAARAAS